MTAHRTVYSGAHKLLYCFIQINAFNATFGRPRLTGRTADSTSYKGDYWQDMMVQSTEKRRLIFRRPKPLTQFAPSSKPYSSVLYRLDDSMLIGNAVKLFY